MTSKRLNLFDALFVTVAVLFLLLLGLLYFNKTKDLGQPMSVTVAIVQNAEVVLPEAQKMGTVYLNGQKQASRIVDAQKEGERILLKIEGLGKKEEEVYLFNGQRILIGQKAELHGGFWAQGHIAEISINEAN